MDCDTPEMDLKWCPLDIAVQSLETLTVVYYCFQINFKSFNSFDNELKKCLCITPKNAKKNVNGQLYD